MTAVWRRVKCQQTNPDLSSKSCRLMRWIDGKESLKDNVPQCVSNVFFGGRLLRWKRIDWCPEVSCASPWSLSLRLCVECQLWQLSSMFAQRYIIVINELPTREGSEGPDFRESTPDPLAGRRAPRRTCSNDKVILAVWLFFDPRFQLKSVVQTADNVVIQCRASKYDDWRLFIQSVQRSQRPPPLGTRNPESWAYLGPSVTSFTGEEHRDGLVKCPRNAGGRTITSSRLRPRPEAWQLRRTAFRVCWTSSLSTLAHVTKCGKLRRTYDTWDMNSGNFANMILLRIFLKQKE